ncbi:saccharopine dehydrogenase family protein [Streptosporangium canum]|uniref:saccharopine dehydrogenase family protein n=1 Tax=Streptosporangium canum TaxID=324952 RepID=UPI0036BF09BB
MTTAKCGGGAVLVVGGYGAVGVTATRTLAGWFPDRIVPAGRDLARARRLASEVGSGRAARVDVADSPGFARVLEDNRVGAVVLCVEPPDAAIARACLAGGVHLVDVGASHHLLAQVDALGEQAAARGATAVLSVGVAPGLTNQLARRAHEEVGGADRLDVTVLLGSGESHGADAVRWTVAQLAAPAERRAGGGTRPRRVALPGYGIRTAHPFPFSDQHTLRRTLGVPEVTTRMCLDSAPLTAALFGLRRAGAFRAARNSYARRVLTSALTRVHLGGEGFAVRADAFGGDRHAAYALTGSAQSRVTGLVAAHVTRRLLTGGLPAGVHHLDQLRDLASLPENLSRYGTTLWTPDALQAAS